MRPLVVFLSLVIPLVFVVAAPLDSYADETLDRLRPLPESEWSPEILRLLRGTHDRVATLEGQNRGCKEQLSYLPRSLEGG